MRGIDTNLLVRWIARDDPEPTVRVDAVLATASFVPPTVLVETVRVLEGRSDAPDRAVIADLLDRVVTADSISLDHEAAVRWAIARYRDGADFADMIHPVAASQVDRFVTFDRRRARQAGDAPPLPIDTLA